MPVPQPQLSRLRGGTEPRLTPEVDHLAGTAKHGGDDQCVTGHSAHRLRREQLPRVCVAEGLPRACKPIPEGLEVNGDEQLGLHSRRRYVSPCHGSPHELHELHELHERIATPPGARPQVWLALKWPRGGQRPERRLEDCPALRVQDQPLLGQTEPVDVRLRQRDETLRGILLQDGHSELLRSGEGACGVDPLSPFCVRRGRCCPARAGLGGYALDAHRGRHTAGLGGRGPPCSAPRSSSPRAGAAALVAGTVVALEDADTSLAAADDIVTSRLG